LAFSFSNGGPGGSAADSPEATDKPNQPAEAPAPAATQPPGLARFNSCRWQQPVENGIAAFCTHREVKPYAGTTGFDAEAWCPECAFYKLRRTPKKRERLDFSY